MIQMGGIFFFLVRLQPEYGGMINRLLPFKKKKGHLAGRLGSVILKVGLEVGDPWILR